METLRKEKIFEDLKNLFLSCEGNVVDDEVALEGCLGLKIFDEPIFGVSAADDELYTAFKQPDVIGDFYMTPQEWLPGAKSVISFFLPFSERLRKANTKDPLHTANEWLHGRKEGQACIDDFTAKAKAYFAAMGIDALVPWTDPRLKEQRRPVNEGDPEGVHIMCTWSERHAAYVSGLGTFSLTRALITEKGVAGRVGSIIIAADLEPTKRPYTGLYDYCTRCGACIKRCPVHAITLEHGKNQLICQSRVNSPNEFHPGRYGCGKCEVGIPCETKIPGRKSAK